MSVWAERFAEQLDLAGVILVIMFVGMASIFWLAQRGGPDSFDMRRMLVDDDDKPSVLRILAVGVFAVMSWILMKQALTTGGVDSLVVTLYVAVFGGGPIGVKLIEALEAKWKTKA